jgi:hypothetical protein
MSAFADVSFMSAALTRSEPIVADQKAAKGE